MSRTVEIPFIFEARVTFNGGGSALPYANILDVIEVETNLSDDEIAQHFGSKDTLASEGVTISCDLDGGILAPSDRQVQVNAILARLRDLELLYALR